MFEAISERTVSCHLLNHESWHLNKRIPSQLVQSVTLLACIREVTGSTIQSKVFVVFLSPATDSVIK
jgi:hypothetical protein